MRDHPGDRARGARVGHAGRRQAEDELSPQLEDRGEDEQDRGRESRRLHQPIIVVGGVTMRQARPRPSGWVPDDTMRRALTR